MYCTWPLEVCKWKGEEGNKGDKDVHDPDGSFHFWPLPRGCPDVTIALLNKQEAGSDPKKNKKERKREAVVLGAAKFGAEAAFDGAVTQRQEQYNVRADVAPSRRGRMVQLDNAVLLGWVLLRLLCSSMFPLSAGTDWFDL